MAGLHGEYRRRLNKGRVNMPSDFRLELPENMVVFESIGSDCLWLMGEEGFGSWLAELFEARFGGYDPSNRQQTLARAVLLGRALPCKIGKSGSLGIPAELRERLGLDGSVVLVGVSDHVEIWNPQAWNDMNLHDMLPDKRTQKSTEWDSACIPPMG